VVGLALPKEEADEERAGVPFTRSVGPTVVRKMSKEQEELRLAMSVVAHDEAHKHLSEAGREVLEMMEYASRNTGRSITDVYVEASATASLSARDHDIIKAYLARLSLIEAFSEETVGEE
jgi:hypothetical protein